MGTKELREAFNSISVPVGTCSKAWMHYDREGGVEAQILTFQGNFSDGTPFVVKSGRIGPNTDLTIASRETATAMLQKRNPQK